jgi:hypothetical protein
MTTAPASQPAPAPQLPATVRNIGAYQLGMNHGPDGYQAYAVGGFPSRTVARSPWLPTPGAALAHIAAAVTPNFTRAAARDLAPPRDDD